MRDFHTWVSDMANSIEDGSYHNKERQQQAASQMTDLQKRMMIADMLVPHPVTEDGINDWLRAFRVVMQGNFEGFKTPRVGLVAEILGEDKASEFFACENSLDVKKWFVSLREEIKRGVIYDIQV